MGRMGNRGTGDMGTALVVSLSRKGTTEAGSPSSPARYGFHHLPLSEKAALASLLRSLAYLRWRTTE